MKVISEKAYDGFIFQRFSLNDTFSTSANNKGLIICYALATCPKVRMVSLELEADFEEIGVPTAWYRKHTNESFTVAYKTIHDFLDVYDHDDFGEWDLTVVYQNIEISICGRRAETEIGLSYPKEIKLNLLPLLYEVETSTFGYNDYDPAVLDLLKRDYKMSEKRAVLTVQKLLSHKDIYDEFVEAATSGKPASGPSAIKVEGFTAEELHSKYPLSILGAYNFLIYLRESPEAALEDLKKGLPKK